jgi:hypothetical protein
MVSKSTSPQNLSKNKSTPKESKSSASPRIVIGKIYSDSCWHCTKMQPEWEKMKKNIKNKCSSYNIPEPECLDIEINTNLDDLDKFNNNNNNQEFLQQTNIKYEYVPTIFVIYKDGIKYYEGERTCDKMESFMLDRYYNHHDIPVSIGGKKSKKAKKTKSKKAKSKTKSNKVESKKTKKNFFAIFGF